jgi:hypothetical protein
MSNFYPISPLEIKKELDSLSFSWWICAGWALELYVGNKIREHHDMDIAILRKDQFKLKEQLPGWEFKIAVNGELYDWGEHEINPSLHALWAKKNGQEKWVTEFLLNESTDTDWVFRKNHDITYPLDIPLLFKSAHCSEKDNTDFFTVVNKLDAKNKLILKNWIKKFQPECLWLNSL